MLLQLTLREDNVVLLESLWPKLVAQHQNPDQAMDDICFELQSLHAEAAPINCLRWLLTTQPGVIQSLSSELNRCALFTSLVPFLACTHPAPGDFR